MAVTDDERRDVARRLRGIKDTREGCGHELCCDLWAAVFDSDYRCSDLCDECEAAVLDDLADLIEPHQGSGGRTILCAHCESVSWCGCEPGDEEGGCDFEPSVTEGEPPYNLYSLYEAVLRRRPRDEYAIDDDEVDELVDALLDICNAPGHDIIQRPQPSCDRDALLALADEMEIDGAGALDDGDWCKPLLVEYARRIREACGEAVA